MTKQELLDKLKACTQDRDTESAHYDADVAILAYLNDPEITAAWEALDKWFA